MRFTLDVQVYPDALWLTWTQDNMILVQVRVRDVDSLNTAVVLVRNTLEQSLKDVMVKKGQGK